MIQWLSLGVFTAMVQVQSLVWKLGFCKQCDAAKKKKKKKKKSHYIVEKLSDQRGEITYSV